MSVGENVDGSDSGVGGMRAAVVCAAGKGDDGAEASRCRATMPLMLFANQWM